MYAPASFCCQAVSLQSFSRPFPVEHIKKIFPPVVVGPVIMLIGIALIGAGFGDWGGGTFCGQRVIYNGFSNNLVSAVVTNDGPSGFTSTDGVSSIYAANRAKPGFHEVNVSVAAFQAVFTPPGVSFNASTAASTFVQMMIPDGVGSSANAWYGANLGLNASAMSYPNGAFTATTGTGFFTNFACNSAGNVFDVYGATEYVGLGVLSACPARWRIA